MNPMKNIKVEKVTLNIGVGSPGDKMEKAMRLLKSITGLNAIQTSSTKRIPTWGVRPKLAIACKVTVRGKKAEELLARLFGAVDNTLAVRKFDKFGNFSFGIAEYIDIPGVPYDASIGVIGLEAAVTLERPGFRVKKRSKNKSKIAGRHKITTNESVEFVKSKFKINVEVAE